MQKMNHKIFFLLAVKIRIIVICFQEEKDFHFYGFLKFTFCSSSCVMCIFNKNDITTSFLECSYARLNTLYKLFVILLLIAAFHGRNLKALKLIYVVMNAIVFYLKENSQKLFYYYKCIFTK